jgi:hypothetical protein
VSVAFRRGVHKYSIHAGYPYFGEDAGATRLVEYETAVLKLSRPAEPSDDARADLRVAGRSHFDPGWIVGGH